jgi:hypothetical protein
LKEIKNITWMIFLELFLPQILKILVYNNPYWEINLSVKQEGGWGGWKEEGRKGRRGGGEGGGRGGGEDGRMGGWEDGRMAEMKGEDGQCRGPIYLLSSSNWLGMGEGLLSGKILRKFSGNGQYNDNSAV